jgi:hypothetical protein
MCRDLERLRNFTRVGLLLSRFVDVPGLLGHGADSAEQIVPSAFSMYLRDKRASHGKGQYHLA